MRYAKAVFVVMFMAIALSACGGSSTTKTQDDPGISIETAATPVSETSVEAVQATPSPTVQLIPQPQQVAPGDSVIIPKIKVDSPLVLFQAVPGEEMPAPKGALEVAYYSFPPDIGVGGKVGQPGNAVFSGHVDLVVNNTPRTAVFWDLHKLDDGDEIRIKVGKDTYKYTVTENRLEPANPPADDLYYWNRIVEATEAETITLITCGGDFDPKTRSYNKRRVVTAVRTFS